MEDLREGETVEFKEQWTDRALEDLASFANHQGGLLLVGVRDDGVAVGFAPDDAELRRIANQVVDVLGVRPTVERQSFQGTQVLAVRVPAVDGLVPCRGRYFVRVGSTNRDLAPEDVARRALERAGLGWDALPVPGSVDEHAISEGTLRRFIGLAAGRLTSAQEEEPVSALLEKLRLTEGSRLRRAALLLFGQEPQRVFPSTQVRIARFAGEAIADERPPIAGNVFDQLDEALKALRGMLQVRVEIPSNGDGGDVTSLQRREIWEYPLPALREALVNALIHRDYTQSGDIQVRVSQDQLDVWNPGGLPAGMSVEDLRRAGHVSRPRNPLLAQVFYYAGLVEQWGTGTTRIIAVCRAAGLPEPEFREEAGGMRVVLSKDLLTPERLRAAGLNERQIQAMLHVKSERRITSQTYQRLTGASKPTATRDLEDLVKRDLLERVGQTGRGTRYIPKGS